MYEREVSNGIALLNEHFGGPAWVEQIDLSTLHLATVSYCVCGQLFGSFGQGLAALSIMDNNVARERGFRLDTSNYGPLTKEWRRQLTEIKVRRGVPAKEPVPA